MICSRSKSLIVCALTALTLFATAMPSFAVSAEQITRMTGDIKAGPAVYYTPEAAAYFATLGNYAVSGLSVDKDAATRSFIAASKLGAARLAEAREAVAALIDVFPKAVHVVSLPQARYAGEGTFEDCVSTYVMSAKNQFMLSSPFLDYNAMSLCDAFIESSYDTEILEKQAGKSGIISSALFNLRITFTLYAGECALSRITGMDLGHDGASWRQWWLASSSGTYGGAAPVTYTTTAAAVPQKDFSDIQVKGKYRIILNTGDDFTGTVENRDATSIIFETTEGKPYTFNFSLIQNYQLIQAPPPVAPQIGKVATGAQYISYDELKLRASANPVIDVKIANGSLFRGKLVFIDDESMKLDVDGSMIPIVKNVVKQIIIRPLTTAGDTVPPAPQKPRGPFDSLWIKNIQSDKYGKAKSDLLYSGTIVDEGDNYVTLKNIDGGVPQKFARDEINRYVRHTRASPKAGNEVEEIARYAKPLACPTGMVMVDMLPGRKGKPFFKVCIDQYEYPNKSGNLPRSNISFEQANKFCADQGKRLCTDQEWMWACGGLDGFVYPYGNTMEQDRCNTDTRLVPSGQKVNCSSAFGASDMTGNVFEWVTAADGKPALMGGPFSKCQTVSASASGDAKPQNGLRCCKSN